MSETVSFIVTIHEVEPPVSKDEVEDALADVLGDMHDYSFVEVEEKR